MRFLIRKYENDKCIKAEYREFSSMWEALNKYEYDKETQTIKVTVSDNGNRDRDD